MTINDFYKLTISDSKKLTNTILKEGVVTGEVFNKDTYRINKLIQYKKDTFQIDSYLGIVEIRPGR